MPIVEPLESRIAPATVHWLNGSGNWSDSTHWQGGVVPNNNGNTSYDVIIDVPGVTVTVNQSFTIDSLDNAETVAVTTGTLAISQGVTDSGTINVTGAATKLNLSGTINVTGQISAATGQLNVNNASLSAKGAGATVANNGPATTMTAVNLTATGGGHIFLPAVTSYSGGSIDTTLSASGSGSKIDLSNLQTFKGGGLPNLPVATHVLPTNLGEIDLAGAISVNPGAFSNDFTLDDTGGILGVAKIKSLDYTYLTVGGGQTLTFTVLTTLTNTSLIATAASKLFFPAASAYSGGSIDTTLSATGNGSKIDLSNLQTFKGGGLPNLPVATHVLPTNLGEIDLAGAISVNSGAFSNDFTLDNTGGILGVAGITSLAYTTFTANDGVTWTLPAGWAPTLGAGVSFNNGGTASSNFVNLAKLTASGAGVAINTNNFHNQGVLNPVSNGSFNFSGDLPLDHVSGHNGIIIGDGTGTVTIGGALRGTAQDTGLTATQVSSAYAQATVSFNGAGTMNAPQKLEAMSQDVGDTELGFFSTFAFETLTLNNNTFVRLVNEVNNAPGAGHEAVYVNNLIVPDGCTLDLNHLHLYYHTKSGTGQIVDGTKRGTAIQVTPLTVTTDQTTATFVEPDRDVITVHVTVGKLDSNPDPSINKNIKISLASTGRGYVLDELDLTPAQGKYDGANVTVTAKGVAGAVPGISHLQTGVRASAGIGNVGIPGMADMGWLNAQNTDLNNVTVDGHVNQITAGKDIPKKPAIQVLTVDSFGAGPGTISPPKSPIAGAIVRVAVKHDVAGADIEVTKGVGQVVVGGKIMDSTFHIGNGLALLSVADTVTKSTSSSVTNSIFDIAGALGVFSATKGVENSTFTVNDSLGSFMAAHGNLSNVKLTAAKKLGQLIVGGAIEDGTSLSIAGPMTLLKAGAGIQNTTLAIHDLPSLTVTGDLSGVTLNAAKLGQLVVTGAIKSGSHIDVTGPMILLKAGAGIDNSTLTLHDALTSLSVKGDVNKTTLNIAKKLGLLTVTGKIEGGSTVDVTGAVGSIKSAGVANSTLRFHDLVSNLAVTGDVTGSEVRVGSALKALSVTRSVIGSNISALGTLQPTLATAIAFGPITIGKDFQSSNLQAGYDLNGVAKNPDVTVGALAIHGSFDSSNILVGTKSNTNDVINSKLISSGNAIVAKIASIVIGEVKPKQGAGTCGIGAEEIGFLRIGTTIKELAKGPHNDTAPILLAAGTYALEVPPV